jgi:hypothetical protein
MAEAVKLNLRLEKSLHRRLVKATETTQNSLQQEIVARLEASFADRPPENIQKYIETTATMTLKGLEDMIRRGDLKLADADKRGEGS